MYKFVIRFAFLLISFWVLTACAAGPKIVAEPGAVDLGKIPAVGLVSTTLQVRNTGNAPLQIANLRTSCGCTQAKIAAERIESGEESELTIVFDPQAHPGLYGPLLRMVYIQSDDPNMPELEIPVQVDVLEPDGDIE